MALTFYFSDRNQIESLDFCCEMGTMCDLPDSECPFAKSEHFTPDKKKVGAPTHLGVSSPKGVSVECSQAIHAYNPRRFKLALWHTYNSLPGLRESRPWLEPPEDLQLRK